MTFREYAIKCECSVRCYQAILRHGISESTDLSDISKYRNIGIRTGAELIDLQILFNMQK